MTMARQCAGVEGSIIGDRQCSVRCYYVEIKTHHAFSSCILVLRTHAVRGVTGRTRKPVVDMPRMLGEACIGEHLLQIVTFATECVWAIHGEIGIWKQIIHQSTGDGCSAEFITPFQNVAEFRSMRSVRARTAKLAIVVAVVTIRA